MLKESDIKEFYDHVAGLGLKFPVAAISKATGWNKGNVSQYLSGKLDPSESFLEAYYKSFPKGIRKVSREKTEGATTEDKVESLSALISVLVSEVAALRGQLSGEHPGVILKKIYKAASDMQKISSDG